LTCANRLVAFGAERVGSVVEGLIRGTMFATPQSAPDPDPDPDKDRQFFVMHEWLQARAAERLVGNPPRRRRRSGA